MCKCRDPPPLCPGDQVRMARIPACKMWNPAIVVKHVSPRSYSVESDAHEYSSNRRHLRRSTEATNTTRHCSDLAVDVRTLHLNALSSSPSTEFCDRASSQQQEPAITSSAETSQPSTTQPEVWLIESQTDISAQMRTVLRSFKNTVLSAVRFDLL